MFILTHFNSIVTKTISFTLFVMIRFAFGEENVNKRKTASEFINKQTNKKEKDIQTKPYKNETLFFSSNIFRY